MGKRKTSGQDFAKFFSELIQGIDEKESTEWEEKSGGISENLRKAFVDRMDALRDAYDTDFLDYCNTVKALLGVYNFGDLGREDLEEDETDEETERDKTLVLNGISRIIKHVEEVGYNITPYLNEGDCRTILGQKDGKAVPVTLSAMAVFTTLVYFRRAYKRIGLFEEEELVVDGVDLMEKAVEHIADIFVMIVKYIESIGFSGWGFTFDSRAATLNDTYSVVEALGRYEDAFMKDDATKSDPEFVKRITERAAEVYQEESIVERAYDAVYKTAFNVYDRTKTEYGHNIFYSGAVRTGDDVRYIYTKTDYEQISSSNRSSALFNPLYVAMITMLGYNEKEIVIRCFMDNYELAAKYYEEFEVRLSKIAREERKPTLSEYAETIKDKKKKGVNFKEAVQELIVKHAVKSSDYSDQKWSEWYSVARVFQKYLETYEPECLMKIGEYRDYLNSTKDAIDQVQIMYRNFDNSQRLGIVDTDYVMFSALDVNTDIVNISKLNKASIAVSNLRPLLLSSKIMIVNALTKYPQADLEDLFNAILESRYQRFSQEDNTWTDEWLWNADSIDMNSTVRNCEAILYDYFDYYERYELGLKAINGLKRNIGNVVMDSIDENTGEFSLEKALKSDDRLFSFKSMVLEITHRNVEEITARYQENLERQKKEIERITEEKNKLEEEKNREMEEQKKALSELHEQDLKKLEESKLMGDTLRRWISEETQRFLTESLSAIVLNKLNGNYFKATPGSKEVDDPLKKLLGYNCCDECLDANLPAVRDYWKRLREEIAENGETAAAYSEKFRRAMALQQLFDAAFNGIFDRIDVTNIRRYDDNVPTETKNDEIRRNYDDRMESRRTGKEYAPYSEKTEQPVKNENDQKNNI